MPEQPCPDCGVYLEYHGRWHHRISVKCPGCGWNIYAYLTYLDGTYSYEEHGEIEFGNGAERVPCAYSGDMIEPAAVAA